jgi:predicted aspartyl protease
MTQAKRYRASRYRDLLTIHAAIGGAGVVVLRLLVDTGASYTMLPMEVVEHIGCDTQHPIERTRIIAANGIILAPRVALPWFHCLGQRFEDFSVIAHTLPPGLPVDGLLGMDFLHRVRAVISVAEAEIVCH